MVRACLDGEEEGNAFAARQLHSDRGQVKGIRIALLQLHCAVGAHLKIGLNLHASVTYFNHSQYRRGQRQSGATSYGLPKSKLRNRRLDVPNNSKLTDQLLDKTLLHPFLRTKTYCILELVCSLMRGFKQMPFNATHALTGRKLRKSSQASENNTGALCDQYMRKWQWHLVWESVPRHAPWTIP